MKATMETAARLSVVSKQCQQPLFQNIVWQDELDADHWAMSPELTSLYGTASYDDLTDQQKKRLALLEAVNFFSLNIHGECHLVSGIMQRIHRAYDPDINAYLHHFVDEENKHMAFFSEFCRRYGGFIYRERSVAVPREYAPGEADFLFFTKALIFEEIVDAFNTCMAKDGRLHPVARQINECHHLDESRHRAFGRRLVAELHQHWLPTWSEVTVTGIRKYLVAYFNESWKSFYNPDVYRDMHFKEPLQIRHLAMNSDHATKLRQDMSAGVFQFLIQHDILQEEPKL